MAPYRLISVRASTVPCSKCPRLTCGMTFLIRWMPRRINRAVCASCALELQRTGVLRHYRRNRVP